MAYRRGGPLITKSKLFSLACHMTFYAVWPIAWILNFTLYRMSAKGRWKIKELWKKKQNAILVSNHCTILDPILMCLTVMPLSIYHTMLEATVCVPFLGTFVQLLGGMPVPSGKNGKSRFLDGIKLALEKRPFIHIYPEGELYIQNQQVNKFHQGAFLASMELNIPIVPIATVLTEPKTILGWKSVRPRATEYVLDPIYPNKFTNPHEFAEYTRQAIQTEINRRGGTNAYSKGHLERLDVIAKQEEITQGNKN